MVSSGFNHGNLVFFSEAQQGFRYTNVVVEVTLCEQHLIAFCKNRRREFLRSSLAIRTRNLHHGKSQLLAMMVR